MTLHIFIRTAQGAVQAFSPEFPGCSASAPSEKEAVLILRRRVERLAPRGRAVPAGTCVVKLGR